jgi:hypothetical protein
VCTHVTEPRESGAPEAIVETVLAKYAAAKAASMVSECAVRCRWICRRARPRRILLFA